MGKQAVMDQQEGGPLLIECTGEKMHFHALGRGAEVGRFDAGAISPDGSALLLREVEAKTRIAERLGACFSA